MNQKKFFSPTLKIDSGWFLTHDSDNSGREKGYLSSIPEQAVPIPFLGKVHLFLPDAHGIVWYAVRFNNCLPDGGTKVLHIDNADYLSEIYLNGSLAGKHRGCEDDFSLDITSLLLPGENLLCVRVSKPHLEDVDGYCFEQIPHRNNRKDNQIIPGTCLNTFGMCGNVEISRFGKTYLSDAAVLATAESENAHILLEITADSKSETSLDCRIFEKRSGTEICRINYPVRVEKGTHPVEFDIPVPERKLWSPEEPNLYTLSVTAEFDDNQTLIKNFGFRTFTVNPEGWFELNGKRILLRCSHSGNFFPGGNNQPLEEEMWRQDIVKAKACGFNAIRYISGAGFPGELDLCDELGLMVYEEPYAGWLTEVSDKAEEIFREDLLTFVRRDRSHPSVVIIGLLNEVFPRETTSPFNTIAAESLNALRDIDPTRLVLFSSGRWDGNPRQGSVSVPGSRSWQCLWNGESETSEETHRLGEDPLIPNPMIKAVGDVHCYPTVPVSEEHINYVKNWASDSKRPFFLSEFGIGSMFNTSEALACYRTHGVSEYTPDCQKVKSMDEYVNDFFDRFELGRYFTSPAELQRKSESLHCLHRTLCFDMARANPYLAGLSLTGLYDHSICGEGLWTLNRTFKPGIAETLERGFAPLKWCLFVRHTNVYRGKEFEIEAVLANEDILVPGKEYPVTFCIRGNGGVVWRKNSSVCITPEQAKLFSVPVLKEKISLDLPEGEFFFTAEILSDVNATDGCKRFYLTDSSSDTASFNAVAFGCSDKTLALLRKKGAVITVAVPGDNIPAGSLILIGEPKKEECSAVQETVWKSVHSGSRAVFLSRYALKSENSWKTALPIENAPDIEPCYHGNDGWLYHDEYIAFNHPYFDRLPSGGIMEWDYWLNILSGRFSGGSLPDEISACCIGTGICNDNGAESGFNIGTYRYGSGAITAVSYDILPHLGDNPVADRLVLNILNTEFQRLA